MFPRVLSSLAAEIADLDEAAFIRRCPDAWLIWENRPGERSTMPQFTMTMGSSEAPAREFEPAAYRLLGAIKSLTIGRTGDGILIKDSTVSDPHLVLQQEPKGVWTVSDARSKNGTRVDGKPLAPETPLELRSGAQIEMGAVKMTFLSPGGLFRRITAV